MPVADESALGVAVGHLRELLVEPGILMLHDAALPSVTTALAGEPIRGSWWAHPQGAIIFHALEALEDELVTVKLVNEKVTVLGRRYWPALLAIGAAREPWQLRGLVAGARALLARIAAGPVRSNQLDAATRKHVATLERRLLAHVREVHTAGGAHARELVTWSTFRDQRELDEAPGPVEARRVIEDAVRDWRPVRLPWAVEKRSKRS